LVEVLVAVIFVCPALICSALSVMPCVPSGLFHNSTLSVGIGAAKAEIVVAVPTKVMIKGKYHFEDIRVLLKRQDVPAGRALEQHLLTPSLRLL
jgi:hypothetical protein